MSPAASRRLFEPVVRERGQLLSVLVEHANAFGQLVAGHGVLVLLPAVEAISPKGGNSIAVSAIARVALRPSFQALGASWGRGTHDRRGAFCPDRLHSLTCAACRLPAEASPDSPDSLAISDLLQLPPEESRMS